MHVPLKALYRTACFITSRQRASPQTASVGPSEDVTADDVYMQAICCLLVLVVACALSGSRAVELLLPKQPPEGAPALIAGRIPQTGVNDYSFKLLCG